VSLYYLREPRHQPSGNKTLELNSMLEFTIPEHLKILPNDSMEERNRKKKKLKHLKQGYKTSLIDRDMQDKRSKWSNFNEKSKIQGRGHFYAKKNTESIFKTSETINGRVGFMNSGKGMTTYRNKEKYDANIDDAEL
jgi:hypothetical protein